MSSLRADRSLKELGRRIKTARLARGFARADLAQRADVSEKTIQRLEEGDGGVGIGNLALVLAALGTSEALSTILSIEQDAVGLSRALDALPKRGKVFVRARPVAVESVEQEESPIAGERLPVVGF